MTPLLMTAWIYWELPIVLFLVCLVHGATRSDEWPVIWWETAKTVWRVVAFLASIGVVLYLLAFFF